MARCVRLSDSKQRPSTSWPCPSDGSWCCTEAASVVDTPQRNPCTCEASLQSAKTQSCASAAQEVDAASRDDDDAESRDDYWRPLSMESGCRVRKRRFVATNLLRTMHPRQPSHRLQERCRQEMVIIKWMQKYFTLLVSEGVFSFLHSLLGAYEIHRLLRMEHRISTQSQSFTVSDTVSGIVWGHNYYGLYCILAPLLCLITFSVFPADNWIKRTLFFHSISANFRCK